GTRYGSGDPPLAGTAPSRAAHPGPALLREHDPGRDRRPARHLPDARLPPAGPRPRTAPRSAAERPRRPSPRRRRRRVTQADRVLGPGAPASRPPDTTKRA